MNRLLEIFNWLRIFLSPFSIFSGLAIWSWLGLSSPWSYIASLSCIIVGTMVGTIWAEKVRHKQGTTEFMGKLYESPDFDRPAA